MQTRIGHSCMVLNFLDVDFSSNEISDILKNEVDDILTNFTLESLKDWTLTFRASYTNARQPLVSKNTLGSYTSDKIKEITIIIPIPTLDKIKWGVQNDQHIYGEDHFDNLIKNFLPLEIDYQKYDNRTDYILDCMRSGIRLSFNNGFTINKEKFRVIISNKRITVANNAYILLGFKCLL